MYILLYPLPAFGEWTMDRRMERDDLNLIINAIESGRCLAFLGAGACTFFKDNLGKEIKIGLSRFLPQ